MNDNITRTGNKIDEFSSSVDLRFSKIEERLNKYDEAGLVARNSTGNEGSSSTTTASANNVIAADKIRGDVTKEKIISSLRLLLRKVRYIKSPSGYFELNLPMMFENKVHISVATKTSLGNAWRKIKFMFREMVGSLILDLLKEEGSLNVVSTTERWTCDTDLRDDICAIKLSESQLGKFWAATSPIIDQERRCSTATSRATKVQYNDLCLTTGMINFAELFMGTIMLSDKYSDLRKRYSALVSDEVTTTNQNGMRITLEEELNIILDPLTREDTFPALVLRQVESIAAKKKRGTKRKRGED